MSRTKPSQKESEQGRHTDVAETHPPRRSDVNREQNCEGSCRAAKSLSQPPWFARGGRRASEGDHSNPESGPDDALRDEA